MPRPQFRLRSLLILTAIVAVWCWVGPPAWERIQPMFFPPETPVPKTSIRFDFKQATSGVHLTREQEEDLRIKQFIESLSNE